MTTASAVKEEVCVQQLADKVAFDERCMLNWHCCGGKKKKKGRSKTIKEKSNTPKNFTPVKSDAPRLQKQKKKCDTENILADMKYSARLQRGLQQVEDAWRRRRVGKHLSIRGGGGCCCCTPFNSSRWLYRRDSCSETITRQVQNVGCVSTNRKTTHRFKPKHPRSAASAARTWAVKATTDEIIKPEIGPERESS